MGTPKRKIWVKKQNGPTYYRRTVFSLCFEKSDYTGKNTDRGLSRSYSMSPLSVYNILAEIILFSTAQRLRPLLP